MADSAAFFDTSALVPLIVAQPSSQQSAKSVSQIHQAGCCVDCFNRSRRSNLSVRSARCFKRIKRQTRAGPTVATGKKVDRDSGNGSHQTLGHRLT